VAFRRAVKLLVRVLGFALVIVLYLVSAIYVLVELYVTLLLAMLFGGIAFVVVRELAPVLLYVGGAWLAWILIGRLLDRIGLALERRGYRL